MDNLAQELFDNVTGRLDDKDVKALHMVCRKLRSDTQKAFVKRCFETRRLDTSVECLDHLSNLLRFCKYASVVKHLSSIRAVNITMLAMIKPKCRL